MPAWPSTLPRRGKMTWASKCTHLLYTSNLLNLKLDPVLQRTVNCELWTVNCELRTANCELWTGSLSLSRWMNKMGLAAIVYDTHNLQTTAGFSRPDLPNYVLLPESELKMGMNFISLCWNNKCSSQIWGKCKTDLFPVKHTLAPSLSKHVTDLCGLALHCAIHRNACVSLWAWGWSLEVDMLFTFQASALFISVRYLVADHGYYSESDDDNESPTPARKLSGKAAAVQGRTEGKEAPYYLVTSWSEFSASRTFKKKKELTI